MLNYTHTSILYILFGNNMYYVIVYYDTSAIKFYSDECEVYRLSEARVIIAFVMIKHLCTRTVCDFTIQRGLNVHLSSSALIRVR